MSAHVIMHTVMHLIIYKNNGPPLHVLFISGKAVAAMLLWDQKKWM